MYGFRQLARCMIIPMHFWMCDVSMSAMEITLPFFRSHSRLLRGPSRHERHSKHQPLTAPKIRVAG